MNHRRSPFRRGALIAAVAVMLAPTLAAADTGKTETPAPSVSAGVMAAQSLSLSQTESLGSLTTAVSAHPDTYGGVSTNGSSAAVIHLAGGNTQLDSDVLAADDTAGYWDVGVSVDHVKYSLTQLNQIQAEIPATAPFSTLGSGLVKWGVNPDTNKVEVGVVTVTADLVAQAQTAFGDAVSVVRAAPITPLANRYEDTPPYYGGDWLISNSTNCSLGFDVIDFHGNQLGLTAGHCYGMYEDVYNGANKIGYVTSRSYGNRLLDAEFIWNGSSVPDVDARIWVGPPSQSGNASSQVVHGAADSCHGCKVYVDGAKTGQSLGVLVGYPGCMTIGPYVSCGIQQLTPANGQQLCIGGDSGGPVFAYDGKGGVTAVGILTAGDQYGDCYYTRFSDIASQFNVRIATR